MTPRPLIVLSFEGLATSALGCYGSSWNQTPAIDAIAAGGCVWDRFITTIDEPPSTLRQAAGGKAPTWLAPWRQQGAAEFFTDEESIAEVLPPGFDRVETVPRSPAKPDEPPANDIVDSQFGQLVAAAIERDSRSDPWGVMWLHSTFLRNRWDAPRELFPIEDIERDSDEPSEEIELLEAEPVAESTIERPPLIFTQVVPPHLKLESNPHPDLITSWMRTYGCQVRLLDLLIEVLLQSIQAEDPYVVILGTSGFKLGQGGWIGHRGGPLRSADIHLPLIISDCGPLRVPQLTSDKMVPDLLRDLAQPPLISPDQWKQPGPVTAVESTSQRAQRAVNTPGWFFVRDSDSSEHLFLKPDDIEDFNDVRRIRGDVVDHLDLDDHGA